MQPYQVTRLTVYAIYVGQNGINMMNKRQKTKIYKHFAEVVRNAVPKLTDDAIATLPEQVGCTESTLQSWLESTDYDFSVTITQAIALAKLINVPIDELLLVPEDNVLLSNLHELINLSGDVVFYEAVKVLSEYMSVVEEDVTMGLLELLASGEVNMIGGKLCVSNG